MRKLIGLLFLFNALFFACNENDSDGTETNNQILQILSVQVGKVQLEASEITEDVPADKAIVLKFSRSLDTFSVNNNISLVTKDSVNVDFSKIYSNDTKTITLEHQENLEYNTTYILTIKKDLRGAEEEHFSKVTYEFVTEKEALNLKWVKINNKDILTDSRIKDIDFQIQVEVKFDNAIDKSGIEDEIYLTKNGARILSDISFADNDSTIILSNTQQLDYYRKYTLKLSPEITTPNGAIFDGFSKSFYTRLDSTYKLPEITDEELLTKVQRQTFKYFWDFGHPESGLARERNSSGDLVTSGGSGFGIMSIIVGIERDFITREQGLNRLEKILDFLENDADRFHGAFSHWLNGTTGTVIPFSEKDDGGDLVETAFMIQGLLTFRQYLNPNVTEEKEFIDQINRIWEGVEWDWYTQGENVLYWHWSPNYDFEMNHKIRGYNETTITYILAASSPSHSVPADVYHDGYAQNGAMINGNEYYGYKLPLGYDYGGPLFFEHYSFMGLDPRNLEDQYADYWEQAVNHTLINQAYCAENPKGYIGYDESSWGLTASDNHQGYSAHSPTNDLGVITPTAAISSIPYTPGKSMDAIHRFYYMLGDRLWGEYGFHDAFNPTENWYADSYLAIDQGPIIVMIENHRTGLLWDLFMSAPEIQEGLDKLGFTY